MARTTAARPTRPLPCRRSARLVPWLVIGAVALVGLGGASAWSAFGRAPDAPHVHIALPAPSTAAAPTEQGFAADQNRIVVAPRPTVVRESAAVPASVPREASGEAARTVPVAAPPPDDASTCTGWGPAARRPSTCPPAPPAPPRDGMGATRATR